MIASITKENFLPLLTCIQGVAEKNTTVSILKTILIKAEKNQISVYATNMEVFIKSSAPANVVQEGEICVDSKKILEVVRNVYDGEINLEKKENNHLEISQKKFSSNIISYNSKEFPKFDYKEGDFISLSPKVVKEMIKKTAYAISNDDSRYYLNGVYLEEIQKGDKSLLRMVSTDGYRLSFIDFDDVVEKNQIKPIIIPKKGVYEIRKLIDLHGEEGQMGFCMNGKQIIVKYKETTLVSNLIESNYPDYRRLIPKENHGKKIVLRKLPFIESLQRASVTSNPSSKEVVLTFSDRKMNIKSKYPELGDTDEDMNVDYSGDKVKISFNITYVMDILNSIHDDKVDFVMNDSVSPILIRPHGKTSYTCVVSLIKM